ncbi:TIGR02444 family protein [Thiohalospira halophila DSM 15071]|uniref:TIGR02444 family protein n=1 Tax=Thiohalospira halophila DSM 15071 TaxID=1123397 RepID=A0A1I1UX24_9GAMM|nr:TIGR02444 family protein [Thiohalospira halophila]SFD75244.1 TIGR02444 family protein [Thiohalospira halophila DSM 15071]
MTDLSLPEFAKSLYARFGVREACLYLQDEAGCDVVLVLAGAWLGAQGRRLAPLEWRALEQEAAPWREVVVEPLRSVRRHLKEQSGEPAAGDLRERVQQAEIQAELHSLQWLEARLAEAGKAEDNALCRNLEAIVGAGMSAVMQRVFRAGVEDLRRSGLL